MSLTIYNSIWGFVKFILEPYLERRVKKGKEDVHRINERYGISNKIRPKGTLIWLHGTSVGESVAALALANSMKKNGFGKNNNEFFLLTTNTLSAAKLIKDKIKKGLPAIHQYHPYDHPEFVSKFLKHWKPSMAVFLESDFWPNLIYLTSTILLGQDQNVHHGHAQRQQRDRDRHPLHLCQGAHTQGARNREDYRRGVCLW